MHIPDGFLDTKVWLSTALLSAGAVAYSIKKFNEMSERADGGKPELESGEGFTESSAPLMGVMGAFIFAAQMLNFPVAGGTSGHLIGGVLAATLLGPYRATLVMTAILIVQCLLFQDGGLTALGANVLNMGVIATMAGYVVSIAVRKAFGGGVRGLSYGAFIASWFSVVLAAAAASLELALSGTVPLGVVLPAMVGWHMLIGIGEGLITAGVVAYLAHVRPDLIEGLGKIPLEARL